MVIDVMYKLKCIYVKPIKRLIIFFGCILFGCNSYEETYEWGENPTQKVIQRAIEKFDLKKIEQVKDRNIVLYKHIEVLTTANKYLKNHVEPWFVDYYICNIKETEKNYHVICDNPYPPDYSMNLLGSSEVQIVLDIKTLKLKKILSLE